MGEARSPWGSGAPTAGAEIQEKMVKENGEGGRGKEAEGCGGREGNVNRS